MRRDWTRLRFALYVLLLALIPVGIAYWAFARVAAGNEVERADAQMSASLSAAVTEFNTFLSAADKRGLEVAARPAVEADVHGPGRRVGRVSVAVPLDQALLGQLSRDVGLGRGDALALTAGERSAVATDGVAPDRDLASNRPTDVRVGRDTYRALAAPLTDSEGAKLVVLRSRAAIADDAGDLRERIGLSALAMLG
ncbi:MAG TPA: hypothetical protein VHF23_06440, partial [Gaiellaceae bacterium]|nr:hypothetical protein [Gaiellaceae bacterium]